MALIPIALAANQPPDRFYAGGEQIAAFRGLPWQGGNVPEDWVGATTTLFGETSLGLSVLPDGRLLRDVIASDPVGWLGAQHVARFGADTMLLTKLLDAGQRLPVHIHPDATFAADHLHRTHGKTEAWVVLGGGTVHLGFKDRLSPDLLGELVQEQDVRTLLGAMHQLEVSTGDAVLVPAGMPHAIGAGVFLVEVQEPEDLSILLEWRDFAIDGPRDGHLGLKIRPGAEGHRPHRLLRSGDRGPGVAPNENRSGPAGSGGGLLPGRPSRSRRRPRRELRRTRDNPRPGRSASGGCGPCRGGPLRARDPRPAPGRLVGDRR